MHDDQAVSENGGGWRRALRARIDAALGDASTLVVCGIAYALALTAAASAVRGMPEAPPMLAALAGMVAATLTVFVLATLLDNASVYDPFWSVAPPILLLYLVATAEPPADGQARIWLVLALVTLWALRLTANCLLRWPRLADEDFRYQDLRRASGGWFWAVNLTGIEVFPTLLVFAGCLPLFAITGSGGALTPLDILATLVAAAAIALETLADLQLRRHRENGPRGKILTRGVWRWSQHPNYLGEIGFWWALFLFGLAAGAPWWTAIGVAAMTALFWFISIPMMLARKRLRHPDYDASVRGIPVLLPHPWPRRRPGG